MIGVQDIDCAKVSSTSGVRWNCTCSFAHQGTKESIVAANCSTSCDCERVTAGSTGNRWMCSCDNGLLPTVATDEMNNKCFTACNCSSGGSFSDTQAARKHTSSKIVMIILLICVVVITLAFGASIVCYFYQRDKYKPQRFLSDKGSSYSSGTYLIRHKPVTVSRLNLGFLRTPISGCIKIASLLFDRRMGIVHGTVIQFQYSELEHATNKFSVANLIGVGGSSHVYRGHLKDGRIVAVKRLKTSEGLDSESEFLKEVQIISRLHCFHIVPLLGYCSISLGKHAERLLVFEYLPNGNLRDCLDGASGNYLDWVTRVTIALGVARGLEYLHEYAAPRIFHRDVKSTNILLDENWKPKVTDLGMAKRLSTDGFPSCSSSPDRMQGTFGYFAPEYAIVGKGSLKSDVFSFGVVLLELITGRTPIFRATDKGEESLVVWAAPRLQNSKRVISELPDPNLEGNFPAEEMQMLAYIAKECLLLDPESRPSMSEVVQILSTIAPDISRRRRFSINLIESLASHSTRSQQSIPEKCTDQVEVPIDSEELKQLSASRWSSPCSFSSENDRTLFTESIGQEFHLSSTHYIDRMLFLTSNWQHSNTNNDDEIVDLMEPRLETFCVGNGQ